MFSSSSQTIHFIVVQPVSSQSLLEDDATADNETEYTYESWQDLDYRLDWDYDDQYYLVFEFDEFTIIFNLNNKNLYITYA